MERWKCREACGVFGVSITDNEGAGLTYNALLALQHRGQESAGIAVLVGRSIRCIREQGLVSEVFNGETLEKLPPSAMALGHVQYSTIGADSKENAQPMVVEYLRGRIAVAYNGQLVNGDAIKRDLEKKGCDFTVNTDAQIIANLIATEALECEDIEDAVAKAAAQLRGAFSLIVLSSQGKLIALRDGWGFKPLCVGKGELGLAMASESCALDSAGFELIRDIKPGEMLIIDQEQHMDSRQILKAERQGLCIFEFVYFARPDSVIDELSVYQARYMAGKILADEHPIKADIVCGVPDSGLEAAQGYSARSRIPFVSGFLKNRYIGRSFIYPSQKQREAAVRVKLNPLKANIQGKKIILVDDSIVRGTTSEKIIKALKGAGAAEVHLRIASPPFKHTCHFGTDVDDEQSLVANRISQEELRLQIGADSLGHISLDGLKEACGSCALPFCVGCFSGDYPLRLS
ncbi:MAG: amidophosphoribosyltransferase [Peptococcaceae bacterium]|jgi:amidophosphoribosyltransferase|nr:amidophosphoribosyltransferase [Peptococcaceae bacterium]